MDIPWRYIGGFVALVVLFIVLGSIFSGADGAGAGADGAGAGAGAGADGAGSDDGTADPSGTESTTTAGSTTGSASASQTSTPSTPRRPPPPEQPEETEEQRRERLCSVLAGCNNHGSCLLQGDVATCDCDSGYTGDLCNEERCQNGGSYNESNDSCECINNYTWIWGGNHHNPAHHFATPPHEARPCGIACTQHGRRTRGSVYAGKVLGQTPTQARAFVQLLHATWTINVRLGTRPAGALGSIR